MQSLPKSCTANKEDGMGGPENSLETYELKDYSDGTRWLLMKLRGQSHFWWMPVQTRLWSPQLGSGAFAYCFTATKSMWTQRLPKSPLGGSPWPFGVDSADRVAVLSASSSLLSTTTNWSRSDSLHFEIHYYRVDMIGWCISSSHSFPVPHFRH